MLKISVLMTVYNAAEILDKSIQGILEQTYQNIEFVIVNDGSADKSADIIEKYAEKDQRIVFINRIENKGRVYSLNEGLQHCSGDWIAINDADDVSYDFRLETLTKYIYDQKLEDTFGVVGSASKYIDMTQDITYDYHVKYGKPGKKQLSMFRMFYSMPFAHSTFIYNKKALLEVGGFSREVTAWIDYFTLIKIAVKYPIYALDEVLVERYIDGNNFFLTPKMKSQRSKNEKIINEWKKDNFPNYKIYSFICNLIRKVKK